MSTPYAEVFIQMIRTEAGGRSSQVLFDETYRPHLQVGSGELLGVQFVDGPADPIQPGESSFGTVKFVYYPDLSYDSLAEGVQFKVLEGARIVGVGRVTRR